MQIKYSTQNIVEQVFVVINNVFNFLTSAAKPGS